MEETKLVIFDMDGLLLDTERLSNIAWIEAGKNMEIDITYDILRRIKGGNLKNTVSVLMSFLDEEKYKKLIEEKKRIQVRVEEEEGIRLKKGVLELLTFLKEKKIKTAVEHLLEENWQQENYRIQVYMNILMDLFLGTK